MESFLKSMAAAPLSCKGDKLHLMDGFVDPAGWLAVCYFSIHFLRSAGSMRSIA